MSHNVHHFGQKFFQALNLYLSGEDHQATLSYCLYLCSIALPLSFISRNSKKLETDRAKNTPACVCKCAHAILRHWYEKI